MGERSSYYHWRDGFKPNHLELGSLVLDFKNPRGRGCFTSSSWRDTKETPKDMVDETPRSDITFVHKTDSGWGVGHIQTFATLSTLRAAGEYTVVTGKKGRKEELIEPEKYFSDILLQADSAKFWLAVRLSVFRKLEYLHTKAIRPTIWMVTGRYVVENATVRSFTRSASSTSLETTFPLFSIGATELANLNPDVQFSTGSGVLHAAMPKFDGERVFATQYQRIDAGWSLLKSDSPFASIDLFNTLSTQRGGDFKVAKLHVSGERVVGTTDQQEITEEYWEEFDQAVVNLEEEQEELGTTRARGLANAF